MVMLSSMDLTVQFTGAFTKAPANVKAEAASHIKNSTTFYLSNCVRKNLNNATEALDNAQQHNNQAYSKALQHNPHGIIGVVTSMTYADKFEFRLQRELGAHMGINTMTVGDYQLQVDYACQNSLKVDAKQDGIFLKVSYYTFADSTFGLWAKSINLVDYDMAENALGGRWPFNKQPLFPTLPVVAAQRIQSGIQESIQDDAFRFPGL